MSAAEGEPGAVTFVNRFTLNAPVEEFERAFAHTAAFLTRQSGFIRYTLLQQEGKADSYLNIAVWRDAESFRAAVAHPEFPRHAAALRAVSVSEPALYLPRRSFSVEHPAGQE